MNRWLLIRRLRGPAFLLLFGITALLHEWDILSFGQSWPLYLVLAGVLALAERAAFTQPDPMQSPPQYPGAYPPPPPPAGWPAAAAPQAPGTGIVPAGPTDLERTEGGR
jgi:hypothetical protein